MGGTETVTYRETRVFLTLSRNNIFKLILNKLKKDYFDSAIELIIQDRTKNPFIITVEKLIINKKGTIRDEEAYDRIVAIFPQYKEPVKVYCFVLSTDDPTYRKILQKRKNKLTKKDK